MFAIQNQKTKAFVYGTDYRYSPPHQRTSLWRMLTYQSKSDAFDDLRYRKCGKDHKVVCLKTIEVKRVYENETAY